MNERQIGRWRPDSDLSQENYHIRYDLVFSSVVEWAKWMKQVCFVPAVDKRDLVFYFFLLNRNNVTNIGKQDLIANNCRRSCCRARYCGTKPPGCRITPAHRELGSIKTLRRFKEAALGVWILRLSLMVRLAPAGEVSRWGGRRPDETEVVPGVQD